jgi:uncharacterized protein (DUF305 family)
MKRTVTTALAVLIVSVSFAGGYALRNSRGTKTQTPAADIVSADSPEVSFVREMSVHHAQAVDMAERIRKRTDDPALALIATDIVLTQQNQIGRFAGWIEQWGLSPSKPNTGSMAGHNMMPGMATNSDVASIGTLPTVEAERMFLQLMIKHHEGGVTMATKALPKMTQPEVTRIAQSIITSQTSEIKALTELRNKRTTGPA